MNKRIAFFDLVILLFGVIVLNACGSSVNTVAPVQSGVPYPPPQVSPEAITSSKSEPSPPVSVQLILSKAPKLNEVVELDCVINSIFDAANTTVLPEFPGSVVIVSGGMNWTGDLKADTPITLKSTIKIVAEGQVTLMVKASSLQANGDVWADAAYIYLTVSTEAGTVGFPTTENPYPASQPVETPPATTPQR
jgi:hypothetical protein